VDQHADQDEQDEAGNADADEAFLCGADRWIQRRRFD
jgi:hypothetical protein